MGTAVFFELLRLGCTTFSGPFLTYVNSMPIMFN